MRFLFLLLLACPLVSACLTLTNGMTIDKSVDICTGVYFLSAGIRITGSDLLINCHGAVITSLGGGKGISIEHSNNVTIDDCRIVGYQTGFYVRNSTRVLLSDNHLVRNIIGTRFVVVSDSATYNHDVSLKRSFELLESSGNILSLSNKPVRGIFCDDNFCNEPEQALSTFIQPQTSVPAMQNWLIDQLTGRRQIEIFKEYVFGSFI